MGHFQPKECPSGCCFPEEPPPPTPECRIWFEDCRIYWECLDVEGVEEYEVEVKRNNTFVSSEKSGSRYRPQNGTWQLLVDDEVVDEIEITNETFSDTECPPIQWCCEVEDAQFIRLQLPSISFDWQTSISNKDFRTPLIFGNPLWFQGHFVNQAKIRQWVELDNSIGGTYLFGPVESRPFDLCWHQNPIVIGEGTFNSTTEIDGTEWRQGWYLYQEVPSDFQRVCPYKIYRLSRGRVKVLLYSNGCMFLEPQLGTWSGFSTWEGVRLARQGEFPNDPRFGGNYPGQVTTCDTFYQDYTERLNNALLCSLFSSSSGTLPLWSVGRVPLNPRPLCNWVAPYIVGPGSCEVRSDGNFFGNSIGDLWFGGFDCRLSGIFNFNYNSLLSYQVHPNNILLGYVPSSPVFWTIYFWHPDAHHAYEPPHEVTVYNAGTARKDVI